MKRTTTPSRVETLEDRRLLAVPAALGGSERSSIDFSQDWRFIRSDVTNGQSADVSHKRWSLVDLPHTYNASDAANGGNDYYRGGTWYRKELEFGSSWDSRRIFLSVGAAAIKAEVYVNGTFVTSHTGSYAGFNVDITNHVRSGQKNLIALNVDNSEDVNVAGYQGDFSQFGGLTRGVEVFATNRLHVNPLDYGSPGTKLSQRNVSASKATLDIETNVRNDNSKNQSFVLRTSVVDKAGKVVKQVSTSHTVKARKSARLKQSLTVTNPHLWDGVKDPYLYTAYVQVITGSSVIDTLPQTVGFRSIGMDSRGLLLNGKRYDLRGVNLHDDKKNIGTAMTDADRARDIKLITEMGANAVRFSHWQVDQNFYDLADQKGLIVWTEIPLWRRITASEAFTDNSVQQMRELIKQNYNHPSIAYWGLFNELPNNADTQALLNEVQAVAKAEDPTRFTIGATELDNPATINGIPDYVTFNKYYGWYGDYGSSADTRLDNFGPWLAAQKAASPDAPLGMGEYGAGGNIAHHVTDPASGAPTSDPNATQFHPEEYQAYVHERTWEQIEASPTPVWATFIWQMTDSGNDNRNEGSTPGINDKGLVTYDRNVAKDSYYYYKAQWSNQPVLYITGKRNNSRTAGETDIKVYSNQGTSVQLLVNGQSQGNRTDSEGDQVLEWSNVTLPSGNVTVQVKTTKNGKTYTDTVTWNVASGASPQAFASAQSLAAPAATSAAPRRNDFFAADVAIV